MTGAQQNWDPDEHVRFARYRQALVEVAPQDAAGLIARVLADPDPAMANSAVGEYLDGRATELLTDPGHPAWCAVMTGPWQWTTSPPGACASGRCCGR
ncbi:hypothetical protein [Kitasatospora sp. NPDC059673]|uniref:hypothetical protein n=1 Tax=Kitasatospora sp. NPDC059673 TaxID=3346901 RepID=UPI0036C9F22E